MYLINWLRGYIKVIYYKMILLNVRILNYIWLHLKNGQ